MLKIKKERSPNVISLFILIFTWSITFILITFFATIFSSSITWLRGDAFLYSSTNITLSLKIGLGTGVITGGISWLSTKISSHGSDK